MKQEEILNGQVGNTLVTNVKDKLVDRSEVYGTPFKIITLRVDEHEKCFIALGNYRVSGFADKPEELMELIYDMDWEFIMNVMTAVVHTIVKNRDLLEEEVTSAVAEDNVEGRV